jgi:hypothetical protein
MNRPTEKAVAIRELTISSNPPVMLSIGPRPL